MLASGIGITVGAIIMAVDYTLERAYVYSTPEYSLIKLPFEIVQAGFGAIFAMIVCYPPAAEGAVFQGDSSISQMNDKTPALVHGRLF